MVLVGAREVTIPLCLYYGTAKEEVKLMKKVNAMEMRNINGGTKYQCRICASWGKKTIKNNWFTAVCHAYSVHGGDVFVWAFK